MAAMMLIITKQDMGGIEANQKKGWDRALKCNVKVKTQEVKV